MTVGIKIQNRNKNKTLVWEWKWIFLPVKVFQMHLSDALYYDIHVPIKNGVLFYPTEDSLRRDLKIKISSVILNSHFDLLSVILI